MGLDSVELILSVEEHFKIEVPNQVAETLISVGKLHEFVVTELQRLDRQAVDADAIFAELRNIICDQIGVKPEQVVPEALFVRDLQIDQPLW